VLTGAFPLLLNQASNGGESSALPFGARIIRTVRAFVQLESDPWQNGDRGLENLVDELQADLDVEHHPAVLHALRQVITGQESPATLPLAASRAGRAEPATT
jgi:hypothetical protein